MGGGAGHRQAGALANGSEAQGATQVRPAMGHCVWWEAGACRDRLDLDFLRVWRAGARPNPEKTTSVLEGAAVCSKSRRSCPLAMTPCQVERGKPACSSLLVRERTGRQPRPTATGPDIPQALFPQVCGTLPAYRQAVRGSLLKQP